MVVLQQCVTKSNNTPYLDQRLLAVLLALLIHASRNPFEVLRRLLLLSFCLLHFTRAEVSPWLALVQQVERAQLVLRNELLRKRPPEVERFRSTLFRRKECMDVEDVCVAKLSCFSFFLPFFLWDLKSCGVFTLLFRIAFLLASLFCSLL